MEIRDWRFHRTQHSQPIWGQNNTNHEFISCVLPRLEQRLPSYPPVVRIGQINGGCITFFLVLFILDSKVGHIEFLPVALLQLVNSNGYLSEVYNVERYMAGDFVKFTNNAKFVRNRGTLVSDLVLAFSHFTYQASNNELIIVDIQGWTPASNEIGCIFLTDPQIHSDVYRCYGTGNLRQKGIDTFWKEMHPECNHLCQKMHLTRPSQQLDNP